MNQEALRQNVMTLHTPEGDIDWVPVSERLPAFREKYPVSDGWAVTVEATDRLSALPGLGELVKVAVESKRDLTQCGIQVADIRSVVFTAKLINPDGRVVEQRSSSRVIQNHSDQREWECGETAAFQRLLDVLGFPGQRLDQDELDDIQGRRKGVELTTQGKKQSKKEDGESKVTPIQGKQSKTITKQLKARIEKVAKQIEDLGGKASIPDLVTEEQGKKFYETLNQRLIELKTKPEETSD